MGIFLIAPLVLGFTSCENVFHLLARREIAPRAKRSAKRLWGENSRGQVSFLTPGIEAVKDARQDLMSW